jgi:hypothetical protein
MRGEQTRLLVNMSNRRDPDSSRVCRCIETAGVQARATPPDDTVGKDMAYENAGIQNGENVGNRLAVIGLKKKDFTGIEEHILRLSLCLSNISHR